MNLTSINELERMLFHCPEIDLSAFPQASDEEFFLMENSCSSEYVWVFPFVRKKTNGMQSEENGEKPYVEIYFWDVLCPDAYARYIVCDGMRMPEQLEAGFLKYCRDISVRVDILTMVRFNTEVRECFPQWHCGFYKPDDICKLLEAVYYASHPGPREILYKAGLERIAYRLDQLPEVNLIGTTPSSIVGHDLPLKLLRILNRRGLTAVLLKTDRMEHALEVYRAYADHIGKCLPSVNQWRYLDELYSNGGSFAGMRFNPALYQRLADEDGPRILVAYRRYFELRRELKIEKIEKRERVPKAEEVEEAVRTLEFYQKFCETNESEKWNDQFYRRRYYSAPVYEYSDSQFIVMMPESGDEMCREAISMRNCLMNYIYAHALGETTILFLRKKEDPTTPYIDMEIKDDYRITQLYGPCNTRPEKKVFQFLEKYSKEKNISTETMNWRRGGLPDLELEIEEDLLGD